MPPKKSAPSAPLPRKDAHGEPVQLSPNAAFLRTSVTWAAVCQYITTFDRAIGVRDYTVQTLEDDLANSTFVILPKLMHKMLYTLTLDRRINSDTWLIYLRKQHVKRDPLNNPLGTDEEPVEWTAISVQDKLDVLHRVTEWPFNNPTRVRQLMNDDDNFANWRAEPIGYDVKRNAYWFIGGERLWIQRARPLPPQSRKSHAKKKKAPLKPQVNPPKRRGRPPKARPLPATPPTESRDSSSAPRRSKRAAVTEAQNSFSKRRRMLGTRMSSRLHANEEEEGWQQIPDEWLGDDDDKPRESRSSSVKGKSKAGGRGRNIASLVEDDSDLTELSDVAMSDASEKDKDDVKAESKDTASSSDAEDEAKPPEEVPWPPPEDPNFVEWETICTTLDEWNEVTEQFSRSNSAYEKALYKRLSKDLVPYVVDLFKDREKVFIQEVEVVVGRKRSSRLAVIEGERERLKAEEAARAEEDAKLDRTRRLEARERLQISEREMREIEREERRKKQELQAIQELQEAEKKEKALQHNHSQHAPNGNEAQPETAAPVAYGPTGRPIRRTRTALPAQNSGGEATQSERETWELACEICHKKGWNIDDGRVITACESCGKWQHTECHDLADEQAGRPRRDWNAVDFVCKVCQRKQSRNRTPATNGASKAPAGSSHPAHPPHHPVQMTYPQHTPVAPGRSYAPQQPYANGHPVSQPHHISATSSAIMPNGVGPAQMTAQGLPYSSHPYASQYAAQYSAAAYRPPQYPQQHPVPSQHSPAPPHLNGNGSTSQPTAYPPGSAASIALPAHGSPAPYSQAFGTYPSSQSYKAPPAAQYPPVQPNGQPHYWAGQAYGYPPAQSQSGSSAHSQYPATYSTATMPPQNDKTGGYRYMAPSSYDAAQMLAYQAHSNAARQATPAGIPVGAAAPTNGIGYGPPAA